MAIQNAAQVKEWAVRQALKSVVAWEEEDRKSKDLMFLINHDTYVAFMASMEPYEFERLPDGSLRHSLGMRFERTYGDEPLRAVYDLRPVDWEPYPVGPST